MPDPIAFMSYARSDDREGRLTRFREKLSEELRAQTGKEFAIFQDRNDILWGQSWSERIIDSIDATTFLIPILTPSFFASEPCRKELQRFIGREQELRRNDLVLPLYYILVPELEDKAKPPTDDLMRFIGARQRVDWREQRFRPFDNASRRLLAALATQIRDALKRVPPPLPAPRPEASGVKRALLVGVGAFEHATDFPELKSSKPNVEDLQRALGKSGIVNFDVKPLIDPKSIDLKKELQQLVRAAESSDLVILYYAGYARLSTEDGVCLCTTDTDLDVLESTSITLKWLKEKLTDKIGAVRVVIVLDCSYEPAEPGREIDVSKALQTDLGKGKGKCVITSMTQGSQWAEVSGARNSLFTKWLIKGLESWEADRNGDGIITLDELYQYANEHTNNEASKQHPEKWDFELAEPGRYEIARKNRTSEAVPRSKDLDAGTLDLDWVAEVKGRFSRKQIIPFFGDGIYDSGPLSSFELVNALAERAEFMADERPSLATAAEYFEQIRSTWRDDGQRREARKDFLSQFRDILEKQSQNLNLEPKAAHSLVLKMMSAPWLVVSATYDQILEHWLEASGIPFVVVSHILRSSDPLKEGKILLVRHGAPTSGPKWEILESDKVLLEDCADDRKSYRVIYKVMGSPFLHDIVDSSLDIDTVVVTESDHMTFLAHLQNQQTSVPAAFSTPFHDWSLLFLGYNLDVWHYRLVARVFSEALAKTGAKAYAVRQPTSPMETRFWKSLEADLQRSDAATVATVLLSRRSS
jgi:hypothetical protein